MKTEEQVKAQLKKTRTELTKIRRRFEQHDNHEDMELIETTKAEILVLEWVIKNESR